MDPLTLINADCLTALRTLPADSMQCCVTSPPYWGLRDYGVAGQIGLEPTLAEFLSKLVEVFAEVRRVLREDGTLWLNLGDSYAGSWGAQSRGGPPSEKSTLRGNGHAGGGPKIHTLSAVQIEQHPKRTGTGSLARTPGLKNKDLMGIPWRVAFALQDAGWWLRSEIIWHKPNPMPESIADRPTKSHEQIFLLTKSERYFYDADAIKEKSSEGTHARLPGNVRPAKGAVAYANGATEHRTKAGLLDYAKRKRAEAGSGVKNNDSFDEAMAVMPETRNKRTVWTVPSAPYKEAHFATFPPKLIEPCILAGTKPGDLVLDPFGGSGTTGRVALDLGRRAVLIELNPDYCTLIRQRCETTIGLPLA